jgi:actin related protein 2/3 complex subunit 4
MLKHKLVDFIIQFMEEVDKEISEMKLFVSYSPVDRTIAPADILAPVECAGAFCSRVVLDTGKIKCSPRFAAVD